MHRSPPGQMSPPRRHDSMDTQEEPLLSLLTTSHPLISTAIGVPLSAYHTSKAYSPVFRSSAEYVERRFTPVVNTVGSVGRLTGVEGGVRWFLSGRRPSQHRPDDEMLAHKRRRVSPGETCEASAVADMQDGSAVRAQRGRGLSLTSDGVESLPAYDDARSPQYSLEPTGTGSTSCVPRDEMGSASWQSRLVMSTSGLSIAMSEESLRSLRYCLSWLRWANDHLSGVIAALRDALNNYTSTDHSEHERMRLYNTIGELKQDVLKTLKEVVDIVSRYAGGALPENARALVRKHLTSLPQRFRLAQSSTMDGEKGETAQDSNTCNPDDYTTVVANRVVVLALEGLDMMAQVAGVLDGTIVSAEEWCERLGRGGHRGVAVRDAEKGTLCHDGEAPRAIETSPTTSLAEKASEPV